MTPGTIGSVAVNAIVAGLAAGFVLLQGFDWFHLVPTNALWITVAVTAVNAALHYLTGTSK